MNDTTYQQQSYSQSVAHANEAAAINTASADQQNNEEEQIVTSTSNDILSSPAHLEILDTLITSPARISSSTAYDYSSLSPEHGEPNSNLSLDVLNEDGTVPLQSAIDKIALEQDSRRHSTEMPDGAMPTTSSASKAATQPAAAIELLNIFHKTKINKNDGSITNLSNGKLQYNSMTAKMGGREMPPTSVADSGSDKTAAISEILSVNAIEKSTISLPNAPSENHKIILKLSKSGTASDVLDESHIDTDPTTSSCSSSSNSCLMEDTRKVEPLKINLNTHHSSNVVPKITIKPIVKKQTDAGSDYSSSADDEVSGGTCLSQPKSPIPKLTIKSSPAREGNSEPHIVPKLTIRSASEESGTAHSSIVPKLTIKMSDAPAGLMSSCSSPHTLKSASSNSSGCPTSLSHLLEHAPPPLPKLTIKTSVDGTSESIISTISPASLSSSSSSSSIASLPASSNTSGSIMCNAVVSSCASNTTAATVPKLTIKTVQKSEETVPKLTIKTNATGSCVSTAEDSEIGEESSTSKIPKLTIKTGQEHAVIITQHNEVANAQTIPKLTIKTKSFDVEQCLSDATEDSIPEKIPKITIKTNETSGDASPKFCLKTTQHVDSDAHIVPKLTISVTNLECSNVTTPQSPKQPPLVVRQLSTSSRKTESPERIPKLMISRQETAAIVTNHIDVSEKVVPKLTIKSHNIDFPDLKDKSSKFAVRSNSLQDEKIPKLTIKSVPPAQHQSSEESDECLSNDSSSSVVIQEASLAKVVPKLTIKNLSSPKLKMKVVVEDRVARLDATSKKNSKSCEGKVENNLEVAVEKSIETFGDPDPTAVSESVANGESSCSQEFCGFNENTIGSSINAVNAEEIRRNSEDMDIDDVLQGHDPQFFNNVAHFDSSGINVLNIDSALAVPDMYKNPELSHVIDTVDLTSSPSPCSSPVHFTYTDEDPKVPTPPLQQATTPTSIQQSLLLECLQRKTSVIQTAPPIETPKFLLSHLTNTLSSTNHVALPGAQQPTAQQHKLNSNISVKYPQLSERLMANGAHALVRTDLPSEDIVRVSLKEETVIDSIEILDTPEGSPRHEATEEVANCLDESLQAESHLEAAEVFIAGKLSEADNIMRSNNNKSAEAQQQIITVNHVNLKRHSSPSSSIVETELLNDLEGSVSKLRRVEDGIHMATLTILTNDQYPKATILTSPQIIEAVSCGAKSINVEEMSVQLPEDPTPPHRSRKQKHDHILSAPMDEEDPLQQNCNTKIYVLPSSKDAASGTPPVGKKRGRPKKNKVEPQFVEAENDLNANDGTPISDQTKLERVAKTRLNKVQLLHKRLAIDMVAAELPANVITTKNESDAAQSILPARRDRNLRTPLRTSRRVATPNVLPEKNKRNPDVASKSKKKLSVAYDNMTNLNHFGGSNSSLSSACSNSSMSSTNLTATAAASCTLSTTAVAGQIDLTMSSCSSSGSNGSTTATVTTAGAGGSHNSNKSMLPPTTILSSSDPVPDLIFKPNDFSSIMATEQLRSSTSVCSYMRTGIGRKNSRTDSQDEDDAGTGESGADNSGDDSASSSSISKPPGRGRGRGRGRGSRSGSINGSSSGRGPRAHRLGRGASAVAKAIAQSRPRCVGGLKHTPDPERLRSLFNPGPQVFEEDTRMSADLNQTQMSAPQTPTRQPDFLTNEESQSSIVSNSSILDPNIVMKSSKRGKRKIKDTCLAEETEFTVASIAEYDWPPPKGCCPSKNRDTFMIQEQVANYLGIKSFKRKYPQLPRRAVDMEERSWLQEKGFVSEKMCDLGITAVWASDVLDIMYTDFFDKYEEYKDFMRQKHLREIEVKQKALGFNVSSGRGLQARDRAMLSASKWNAYFNKSRKEERLTCIDLQTLTVNTPLPADAPTSTLVGRPIVDAIISAIQAENVSEPPTLLKSKAAFKPICPETSYPLAVVEGQYSEKYRKYGYLHLRSLPVSTVVDDPCTLAERLHLRAAEESEESVLEPSKYNYSIGEGANAFKLRRRCDRSSPKNIKDEEHETKPAHNIAVSESSSSDESSSGSDSDSDAYDSSSSSSSENEVTSPCSVCQRSQNCNLKDLPEVFIKCFTCRRKVHPSCIEMPHRMVARVRNYNWQCADCKCCIKCKRKQDSNKMLYCEQCDRGFHIYCLGVKSVPDGRWSCSRCSFCMRCGATKPEGLPQQQQQITSPNGEKVKQIKHKKVKWINEYRIDHITKLREHCSMLCVPCGRSKSARRAQSTTSSNVGSTGSTASGANGPSARAPPQQQANKQQVHSNQMSPPPPPVSVPPTTNSTAGATTLPPPAVVA